MLRSYFTLPYSPLCRSEGSFEPYTSGYIEEKVPCSFWNQTPAIKAVSPFGSHSINITPSMYILPSRQSTDINTTVQLVAESDDFTVVILKFSQVPMAARSKA
jgi:hypothetical protein